MRSSFGPEKLLLASKKPHIISLVNKVHTLSEDEIRNLNEKPDTIKGLLAIKKQYNQEQAAIRAEIIANQMISNFLKNNC